MEITSRGLLDLVNNSRLSVGQEYTIVDYVGLKFSVIAKSENELNKEYYSGDYLINYDLESMKITHMVDTNNRVEANYDFRKNVFNSKDISIGDNLVAVLYCNNVFLKGEVEGHIEKSSNIIIGSGDVDIQNCNNITIGENNSVLLSSCNNITIGNGNDFSLENKSDVEIGDNNIDVEISGENIVGSDNVGIKINGSSNVVTYGNVNVEIEGNCNTIIESSYASINGHFNDIKKSSLLTLSEAVGNEVNESDSVDISNTNNNTVVSRNLNIENRDALLEYVDVGGIRRVRDKVERINLQADNNARVLVVDHQMFRGETGTKSTKEYAIINGVWTEIEK